MPKWKSAGISSRPTSDAVLSIAINTSGSIIAAGHFDGTVIGYDSTNMSKIKFCFNVSVERRLVASEKGGDDGGSTGVGGGSVIDSEINNKYPITALAFRPKPLASELVVGGSTTTTAAEEVLLIASSDGTVERRVLKIPAVSIAPPPAAAAVVGGSGSSPVGASASSTSSVPSTPLSPPTATIDPSTQAALYTACANTISTIRFRDGRPPHTASQKGGGADGGVYADDDAASYQNEVYAACYNNIYAVPGSNHDNTNKTNSNTTTGVQHQQRVLFATCGLDATVRVYDDATLQLVHVLRTTAAPAGAMMSSTSSLSASSSSSANRLQAVCFGQSNNNIVMAAGWGQTVHFWDISGGETTPPPSAHQEVFGPYAIGQGIASGNGALYAVSYRGGADRLQLMEEPTKVVGGSGRGGGSRPSTATFLTSQRVGSVVAPALTATADGAAVPVTRFQSLPWPQSTNSLNFFPTCVAVSPQSPLDGEFFVTMGGGGGMGLNEASMILSGATREVAAEFLAVGCVNCCAFGVARGDGSSSGNAPLFPNGTLIAAYGDSKGNVQAARYAQ